MASNIVRTKPANSALAVIDLEALAESARVYAAGHLSDATKIAYASDWTRFQKWCESASVEGLPASPAVVALYIAALADAGFAVSTIVRTLASIAKAHEYADVPSPTKDKHVRYAMSGIRRRLEGAPNQVDALSPEDLAKMVEGIWKVSPDVRALRDCAILLVGFAGGFRRSELVAFNRRDAERIEGGYRLHVRRSKTDQYGEGRYVGIPQGRYDITCPVAALDRLLTAMGTTVPNWPLFPGVNRKGDTVNADHRLNSRTIARLVADSAESAGVDGWFAGHSLRAGLVTSAAKAGKPIQDIQAQTGHKSIDMILRYMRREGVLDNNAAQDIGL
jgi:site-specific recombinase XerD